MSSFSNPPVSPPRPSFSPANHAAGAGAPAGKSHKGLVIASLVCGIVSFVVGAGIIIGPAAVILGGIAREGMRNSDNRDGYGVALAGVITGVLGTLLTLTLVGLLMLAGNHAWR